MCLGSSRDPSPSPLGRHLPKLPSRAPAAMRLLLLDCAEHVSPQDHSAFHWLPTHAPGLTLWSPAGLGSNATFLEKVSFHPLSFPFLSQCPPQHWEWPAITRGESSWKQLCLFTALSPGPARAWALQYSVSDCWVSKYIFLNCGKLWPDSVCCL